MLGRLVHLSIDALIISAFLAGVKRSTGLTYVLPWHPLEWCFIVEYWMVLQACSIASAKQRCAT
jgi:Fungal protein of unknown function (DUF1748)